MELVDVKLMFGFSWSHSLKIASISGFGCFH